MELTTLASKGQMLTHEEMDGNFITLKAGVEAAAEDSFLAQFVGAVAPIIGTQRYFPRKAITISNIFAYLSDNAATDVVAQVKVNGSIAQTVTIPTGASSINVAANINVAVGGYVTVDIISGSGNNLALRFDY